MTSSPRSPGSLPDKEYLYGEFQAGQRWRDRVGRKATLKALDIPDDEMNVNVRKGLGWPELLVLGALAIAGAGAAWFAAGGLPASPPPASGQGPADSEYEVRFFDAEGRPIEVPHISEREGR